MDPRAPSGIDPLLPPPAGNNDGERSQPRSSGTSIDPVDQRGGPRLPRHRHPARGARTLALTASVVATGAVATAMAYSEGAFSADTNAAGPIDQSIAAPVGGDSTSAPTTTPETNSVTIPTDISPGAADEAPSTSTTPSTTAAAATTVPETTPAELPVVSSIWVDGVYLGTSEYTEWGDVQVQVTISDGAIVSVTAVEYPTDRKSSSINGRAVPILEADAIAVQGADLDIVSGATYTSRTYADSLQAALDQAAIASAQEGSTS